jgi:hypothetical protein
VVAVGAVVVVVVVYVLQECPSKSWFFILSKLVVVIIHTSCLPFHTRQRIILLTPFYLWLLMLKILKETAHISCSTHVLFHNKSCLVCCTFTLIADLYLLPKIWVRFVTMFLTTLYFPAIKNNILRLKLCRIYGHPIIAIWLSNLDMR